MLEAVYDKIAGIGVDRHVFKSFNALGWSDAKTPEECHQHVEAWMPIGFWRKLNTTYAGLCQLLQDSMAHPQVLAAAREYGQPVLGRVCKIDSLLHR
jgi:endonuclease III